MKNEMESTDFNQQDLSESNAETFKPPFMGVAMCDGRSIVDGRSLKMTDEEIIKSGIEFKAKQFDEIKKVISLKQSLPVTMAAIIELLESEELLKAA